MELDDIIEQIISIRPDLTREKILKKVDAKEAEAKGFLTRESAARALAMELGVKKQPVNFKDSISIGSLIPGLNNIRVLGRVLVVYPTQRFVRSDETEGKIRHLLIGDKTGSMRVVLWDDKADHPNIEKSIDQIAAFSRGYVRQGLKGELELNLGSKGEIQFLPQSATESEFPPLTKFTRSISDITINDVTVNVLGIVERTEPIISFKRQDGTEGKVRRLDLRDSCSRTTVVLWDNKVNEAEDIQNGQYLAIFGVKVKESIDQKLELHAGSSAIVMLLDRKPSGFDNPLGL